MKTAYVTSHLCLFGILNPESLIFLAGRHPPLLADVDIFFKLLLLVQWLRNNEYLVSIAFFLNTFSVANRQFLAQEKSSNQQLWWYRGGSCTAATCAVSSSVTELNVCRTWAHAACVFLGVQLNKKDRPLGPFPLSPKYQINQREARVSQRIWLCERQSFHPSYTKHNLHYANDLPKQNPKMKSVQNIE